MNKYIDTIRPLVRRSPKEFPEHLGHAIEELGEVSRAHRDLQHGTTKNTGKDWEERREDLVEECVDVAVTAFTMFIKAGGTEEEFDEIFMRKCKKWEKGLDEGTP